MCRGSPLKRYRPGPRRRRDIRVPGQSVQVDVKHLKLGSGRLYQFTAIDEATRFRVRRSTTTTRSSPFLGVRATYPNRPGMTLIATREACKGLLSLHHSARTLDRPTNTSRTGIPMITM